MFTLPVALSFSHEFHLFLLIKPEGRMTCTSTIYCILNQQQQQKIRIKKWIFCIWPLSNRLLSRSIISNWWLLGFYLSPQPKCDQSTSQLFISPSAKLSNMLNICQHLAVPLPSSMCQSSLHLSINPPISQPAKILPSIHPAFSHPHIQ